MSVHRHVETSSFGPREIANMTAAYEQALVQLGIERNDDLRTEAVALRILQTVRSGEELVARIVQTAIRELPTSGKTGAE